MVQFSRVPQEQLVDLDWARHWDLLIIEQKDLNINDLVFNVQWY